MVVQLIVIVKFCGQWCYNQQLIVMVAVTLLRYIGTQIQKEDQAERGTYS